MSNVFGATYAQAYDALYQEKDYQAECELLERIFKQYATQSELVPQTTV